MLKRETGDNTEESNEIMFIHNSLVLYLLNKFELIWEVKAERQQTVEQTVVTNSFIFSDQLASLMQ